MMATDEIQEQSNKEKMQRAATLLEHLPPSPAISVHGSRNHSLKFTHESGVYFEVFFSAEHIRRTTAELIAITAAFRYGEWLAKL